jgi:CBS domain-containing protein
MIEQDSLVSALRQLPYLAPEDSIFRAVEMLRYIGTPALPVVDAFGELKGIIDLHCLRPLLGREPDDTDVTQSIDTWMRRPGSLGRTDMSLDEVRGALAAGGETTLFILDSDNRYIGAVTLADLLVPSSVPTRPASIGGMATPWGVYLTNGTIQAGASNLALVGSGVLMGAMLSGSMMGVRLMAWAAQQYLGWPLYSLLNANPPSHMSLQNLGWFVLQGLFFPLFLVLMRILPLAGYHAAEHQAVHAMERGDMLHPDVLRRMPRVHPRCGTNIMAGAMIFTLVSQGLPALQIGLGSSDSAVLGALCTLFTWRSFGAFLQQYFTTRPASDRQIASGIRAAEDLQHKFLMTEPRRPTILRRIWCMGMPQIILGTTVTTSAVYLLLSFLF